MDELMPGSTPERAEAAQASVPVAQTDVPVQEAPASISKQEEPAEKKESPGRAYFKAIAAMMMVFLGIPAIGFFLLFPYFLSFMMYTPQFIPLLPLVYVVYYAVAAYWFFKRGMFQRMLNTSARFGMGWSKKMMKNIDPELKKEMMENAMKDESVKQFKEQLKEELREEMRQEMKKEQPEYGGWREEKPKENY